MDEFENLMIHDRKIMVGIDFGTTYSGVAWAETGRPDRRTHINQWPIDEVNKKAITSEKCPTILHYDGKKTQWGFQINESTPSDKTVHWFKLGLSPNSEKLWRNPMGKKVEDLITDYLSALNKHILFVLSEKLGEAIMRTTPVEYIVTVPAMWDELAKQKTLGACKKAGFKTEKPITLVSEPEAAAIYSLHGLDPHGLKQGDTFVILDAGGGTCDLISYTITSLRPILEVEEAAPGSGGMCGSTFINRRFVEFLKKKLELQDDWDEEILADANERFENVIKKQFSISDADSEVYNVPVSGMKENHSLGIRRGKFALQNKDLRAIFDPVIEETIKLVKEQIKATKKDVKAVLLVGGLGASSYLKDRVKAAVGNKIEVMQPANAWLAVALGSVMKGLAQSSSRLALVSVTSRSARKHYGLELNAPYDHAIHKHIEYKKYMDEKDGFFRVPAMTWFIKKGDKVPENQPYLTHFYVTGLVSSSRINSVPITILCDQTSSIAPVERNGNIPTSAFDQAIGKDGRAYYEVHCDVEAVYLSASTTYTLIHKGKRYDSVTAEYV